MQSNIESSPSPSGSLHNNGGASGPANTNDSDRRCSSTTTGASYRTVNDIPELRDKLSTIFDKGFNVMFPRRLVCTVEAYRGQINQVEVMAFIDEEAIKQDKPLTDSETLFLLELLDKLFTTDYVEKEINEFIRQHFTGHKVSAVSLAAATNVDNIKQSSQVIIGDPYGAELHATAKAQIELFDLRSRGSDYYFWLYNMLEDVKRIDPHRALHLHLVKLLSRGQPSLFDNFTFSPKEGHVTFEETMTLWQRDFVPILDQEFVTPAAFKVAWSNFLGMNMTFPEVKFSNTASRDRDRLKYGKWLLQKLNMELEGILHLRLIMEVTAVHSHVLKKAQPRLNDLSKERIDELLDIGEKKPGNHTGAQRFKDDVLSDDLQVNAITRKAISKTGKPPATKPVLATVPMSVETTEKKPSMRKPFEGKVVCFRCSTTGHTARQCITFVSEIKGCGTCHNRKHTSETCPAVGAKCGRFGCAGEHYASACPTNFLPGQLTTPARLTDGTKAYKPSHDLQVKLVQAYDAYRRKMETQINAIDADDFMELLTADVNALTVYEIATMDHQGETPTEPDPAEVFLRQQGYGGVLHSTSLGYEVELKSDAIYLHDTDAHVFLVAAERENSDSDEKQQKNLRGECHYERLSFYSKTRLHSLSELALLDCGANVNVISLQFFKTAYENKLFHGSDYTQLQPPVLVGVADGRPTYCHGYLQLRFRIGHQRFRLPFLVFPTCSQKLILGEPGLKLCYNLDLAALIKARGQIIVNSIAVNSHPVTSILRDAPLSVQLHGDLARTSEAEPFAWIVPTFRDGERRIQLRCPFYEDARMEPMREGNRRVSEQQKEIARVIFENMVTQGKVKEIPLEQATYTCPFLLVDKTKGSDTYVKLQWPSTSDEITKRFRVTLDLRGLNAAQLLVSQDKLVYLVPKRLTGSIQPDNHTPYQYQPSVWEMLRSLPAEFAVSYGKIDLSDAYSGVIISEAMQRLFCTEVATPNGDRKIFSWLVLPQGWKLSPSIFRMVVHFITTQVERRVTVHFGHKCASIFYLQDDTLVAGSSSEVVAYTLNTLTEVFEFYGFKVNKNKCTPATPQITFCGYLLDGPRMSPTATRRRFSAEIATSVMDHLRNVRIDRLKELRSLSGKLNFLFTHLRPEIRCHLQTLQDAINALIQDKHAVLEVELLSESIHALVDYACHRVPGLALVTFQATHATLIVVDANKTSWSAVCLAIVTLPADRNKLTYSDSTSLIDLVKTIKDFPTHLIPNDAVAVPVRLIGGRFNTTAQQNSSTYRERAAMVLSVDELQADLAGAVIVACDNQNCTKTWHDVDSMFTGELAKKYIIFMEFHHYIVWIPREGLPSLPDAVARLLDDYAVTQQAGYPHKDQVCAATLANATSQPLTEVNPLPQLPAELLANYHTDTTTTYLTMRLADICATLLDPTVERLTAKQRLVVERRFRLVNGFICYLNDGYRRLYVPKYQTSSILADVTASSRSCLLRLCHEGNGPHVGEVATFTNLVTDYWWPGICDDVARYVGSCITCGIEKARKAPLAGVLSSTTLPAYRPFGFVMVDFAELKRPKQTILLIVCCYSRYCIAVPTPDESAESMGRAVYHHLFMAHGVPDQIHSDKGTSFTAEVTRVLMELAGISHTFTINRFPRVQGFVERHVQEVKRLIGTLTPRTVTTVSESLSQVTAVMNFRRQGTHGFAPYEIAFGRAPNTIKSLLMSEEIRQITGSDRNWLQQSTELLHSLANQARISRLQANEDSYTLAAHPSKINVGDRVLLAITIPAPGKIEHQVSGPYVVVAKVASNIYDISDEIWEAGRAIVPNMKTQRRAEMQLRLLDDPADLREGLPRDSRLPAPGIAKTLSRPRGRPKKDAVQPATNLIAVNP